MECSEQLLIWYTTKDTLPAVDKEIFSNEILFITKDEQVFLGIFSKANRDDDKDTWCISGYPGCYYTEDIEYWAEIELPKNNIIHGKTEEFTIEACQDEMD